MFLLGTDICCYWLCHMPQAGNFSNRHIHRSFIQFPNPVPLMSFHMSDPQMVPRLSHPFMNLFTWILIWNNLPISWLPPPFGSSKYPESYSLHTIIWISNHPSFSHLMISKITCRPACWDYLPRSLSPWKFRASHPMRHLPFYIELPTVNRILHCTEIMHSCFKDFPP